MTTIDLGHITATYYAHSEDSSYLAAQQAFVQRNARAHRILDAYTDAEDGFTADEVSDQIGLNRLSGRPLVCRLRQEGYLVWSVDHRKKPVRRLNDTGKAARVLEVTIKGMQAVGR